MKIFLIKVLILGLCSIVFYPILIIVSKLPVVDEFSKNFIELKKGGNGHLWTRLREADTTRNVDVLILGSSLAYRGIDTRAFDEMGIRAFNLGSSSQTPIQTEYLVKKYLHRLNPKYVIWDIHPGSFSNPGLESYVDLLANCSDCEDLDKMMIKLSNLAAFNAYLKKNFYFSNTNDLFKESIEKKNDKYIYGGYVETNIKWSKNLNSFKPFRINFLPKQKAAFNSILEILEKSNIKTYLVTSPKSKEYYSNLLNKKEINDYFKSYEKRNVVVKYLDFNEIIPKFGLNQEFFFDEIHLNQLGVDKYNQVLLQELGPIF